MHLSFENFVAVVVVVVSTDSERDLLNLAVHPQLAFVVAAANWGLEIVDSFVSASCPAPHLLFQRINPLMRTFVSSN